MDLLDKEITTILCEEFNFDKENEKDKMRAEYLEKQTEKIISGRSLK